MALKQHALCEIFPALSEGEMAELAADIKEHGLKTPIVLYKGDVLDGWHRYLACQRAGVKPRTMDYNGANPKAFAKSANWFRRHLNASQRALIQVQLSEWVPPGRPSTDLRKGAPGAPLSTSADLRKGALGVSVATVAEMATESDTAERTIQQAKAVQIDGSDELKKAVKEGKISVKRAAKIARMPKVKQPKAIKAKPKKADAPCAKCKELQEQHAQLLEQFEDLSDELKAEDGAQKDAKAEILKHIQENKRLRRRCDELMNKCVELEKQCRMWRSKYEKLAKAK